MLLDIIDWILDFDTIRRLKRAKGMKFIAIIIFLIITCFILFMEFFE